MEMLLYFYLLHSPGNQKQICNLMGNLGRGYRGCPPTLMLFSPLTTIFEDLRLPYVDRPLGPCSSRVSEFNELREAASRTQFEFPTPS